MTYHDPFDDILAEMSALHTKKGQDYGTAADPYTNVRASEKFGIPGWVGAIVRLNDKIVRIQSFLQKGSLANESLEDSLKDIPVYAVIALLLYREENQQTETVGSDGKAMFVDYPDAKFPLVISSQPSVVPPMPSHGLRV